MQNTTHFTEQDKTVKAITNVHDRKTGKKVGSFRRTYSGWTTDRVAGVEAKFSTKLEAFNHLSATRK